MRKIIGIIFFCFCCHAAAMAQDEPENNDTLSLTDITTRDFMEGNGNGGMDWGAMYRNGPGKGIKCPKDPGGCGGGGFFAWLGDIVCSIGNFFAGLVANDEGGGGGGGGFIWLPYIPGSNFEPPVNPPAGGNGGSVGGGGTAPPTTIIVNVITPPPVKPVVDDETTEEEDSSIIKKDTVQPVKVPCNDSAIARGKYADSLWKELDSTGTAKKRLQDSAKSGKFESAFLIKKNANNKLEAINFTTSNSSTNVTPPPTTDTLYGGAHCHNDKEGVNSQSPSDFFRLLTMFKQQKTYKTDFLTSYDDSEWAIMIGDSLSAMSFINNSNYAYTTLVDTAGENINNWSMTKINPKTKRTYFEDLFDFGKKMATQNYPKELQEAYANIYMINKLFNTGIKVLMKVGGNFKELSIFEDNSSGETILKIKICE